MTEEYNLLRSSVGFIVSDNILLRDENWLYSSAKDKSATNDPHFRSLLYLPSILENYKVKDQLFSMNIGRDGTLLLMVVIVNN